MLTSMENHLLSLPRAYQDGANTTCTAISSHASLITRTHPLTVLV